ncbi:GNAT family N-acetyltransferase [Bacillus sp. 1P06AnD]|uniref:GNAT family N-acetyltransferase n=1 Tax=Bacillus sp. 1P06AnD TaxID=3132208 RepID=UPI0039A3A20C
MWHISNFNDLTKKQLYTIMQERIAVFVVEQHCPYPEIDGLDLSCYHLFYEMDGEIRAYLRVIPSESHASLGRVLVKKDYRGKGLAKELISKGIDYCITNLEVKQINIQAQAYLKDFYGAFGFLPVSDIYLEDNIPHMDMVLKL